MGRSSAEHKMSSHSFQQQCLDELNPGIDMDLGDVPRSVSGNCRCAYRVLLVRGVRQISWYTPRFRLPITHGVEYPCRRVGLDGLCVTIIPLVRSSLLLFVRWGLPFEAGTAFTCSIPNTVAWKCVRGCPYRTVTGSKDHLPHHIDHPIRDSKKQVRDIAMDHLGRPIEPQRLAGYPCDPVLGVRAIDWKRLGSQIISEARLRPRRA